MITIDQQVEPQVTAIPSALALTAAREFDKLLAGIKSKAPSDAYVHEGLARSAFSGMSVSFEDAWLALEAGGWLAIGEDSQGTRLSLVDLVSVAEVWGKHLIPAPFTTTVLARRWMGRAARPSGRAFTYSLGAGALVPFGALESITFLGSIDDGNALPGPITVLDVDDFAPSLPLARVASDTCCASPVARDTIVMLTSETIGGAEFVLNKTVDYANFRKAFGQEIGKFQVIRHRLVGMLRDIETARSLVVYAANDEGAALAACQEATRLIRNVVQLGLQQHGGIGFTWDLGAHRYLRHTIAVEKLLDRYARGRA
jgi:alkylation response protein AidB-like acyl-CoA dehydrogenase